jgi:2-oxoglutarate dehydrogenase E2 component (dihydrolipoamide succinyltransferase)
VIAERLLNSVKHTAMLTTFNEADMSKVIEIRHMHQEAFQQKHGVKLGFMSFFVKAVVSALKSFPAFNTYIEGEELVERNYIDIGVAIGSERGLVVPVLRNCNELSFAEIEKLIVHYAEKSKSGRLGADELVGGSFTISNGGTYGSMLSTPILNPPQCGILGMHKIQKRAVVVNDQIVIRPIMYLALSYDHRVVDGKEAVSFLVHIKNEIEDPSRFILDI